MSNIEQRYSIKFCVLLGKSATETKTLLEQAYGQDSLGKTMVYEWHRRFREGRVTVEDEDRPGAPAIAINQENVAQVQHLILANPRLTVRKIAGTLDISIGSAHAILSEQLGLVRVCSRWVPRLLTPYMK